MRQYPRDNYDQKEAEELQAADWQMEQLKLNPEYNHWGPGEDFMQGP